MKLYFPDYVKEYCPQRKFFWTVYRSLFEDEAQAEIEKHRLEKMGAQNEADTHITISAKFYEEFKDYYAKPGKAPNFREGRLSSQPIDWGPQRWIQILKAKESSWGAEGSFQTGAEEADVRRDGSIPFLARTRSSKRKRQENEGSEWDKFRWIS